MQATEASIKDMLKQGKSTNDAKSAIMAQPFRHNGASGAVETARPNNRNVSSANWGRKAPVCKPLSAVCP